MDAREIEVLLTLADELHFGRTAERLHVSTAAVSQTVSRLERHIGGALFVRTSRRVEITELGRRLVDDLTPAQERIAAAVESARRTATGHRDRLRIGYMSAAVGREVLAFADRYERARPGVGLSFVETSLVDLVGPLRRREVDVSVLPLPVRETDLLVGPVVLTEPAVVAIPRSHPLSGRAEVTVPGLADETQLQVAPLPDYWRDLRQVGTAAGSPVTGFQELLTLVGAGRGVAVVGGQSATLYPRPDVAYVPLAGAAPFEYAVVTRTDDSSDAVRDLLADWSAAASRRPSG